MRAVVLMLKKCGVQPVSWAVPRCHCGDAAHTWWRLRTYTH